MTEKLKTVDAETLLSTPLRKTLFLVDGLIPQGVSIVCGSSKIGKSWLMLWLGLQISQGLPVWECPTEKADVLYLCLEDTFARIQNRLYHLTDNAPNNMRFAVMSSQLGCGLEEQIIGYLKDYPNTKLIIIDTLQKVRNGRASSGKNGMYSDDYDDISSIKRIADKHGIAVILVHHLRKLKDSDDPFNQISGSTGIVGAVDTAFLLRRDTAVSDTATLNAKGRDIEMQQLKLKFNNLVWELVERKKQEQMQKEAVPDFIFRLTDFVKAKQNWTGSATELLVEMSETEITASSATKLITHFYYDELFPQKITFTTRRTGTKRLISLSYDDGNDRNDGKSDMEKTPSLPSQVSQNEGKKDKYQQEE